MAYEPTTWKSGDVVTSAKLNKLENGIASAGVFVINGTSTTPSTLDKNYNEILAAIEAGKLPIAIFDTRDTENGSLKISVVEQMAVMDGVYSVGVNKKLYVAESATDLLSELMS